MTEPIHNSFPSIPWIKIPNSWIENRNPFFLDNSSSSVPPPSQPLSSSSNSRLQARLWRHLSKKLAAALIWCCGWIVIAKEKMHAYLEKEMWPRDKLASKSFQLQALQNFCLSNETGDPHFPRNPLLSFKQELTSTLTHLSRICNRCNQERFKAKQMVSCSYKQQWIRCHDLDMLKTSNGCPLTSECRANKSLARTV